jgi:TrmH family RNA methyltransferase
MRLEVAVMEPLYQINLGYIARVMKNFGVGRLYLINPRCNHLGKQAIQYSKHAHEILENAKICKGIGQVCGDALLIGTTGVWRKGGSSLRNIYSLEAASRFVQRNSGAGRRIVLLLGRDDTGLSKEELRSCDATVFINADKAYPVLNISHALAIMLHSFLQKELCREYSFMSGFYADAKYQSRITRLFMRMIASDKRIKDKATVAMAFRHVLMRAAPTKKEINALAIALSNPEKHRTNQKPSS